MTSENETVAEIVGEMRGIKGGQHTNGGLSFERWRAKCQFADDYADRIESAHKREVAELKCELELTRQQRNRARLDAQEKFMREVAELRECLKEAMTNFCTHRPHEYDDGFGNCESFKNGSCVCEECWRSKSVDKWRKALEGDVI